MTETSSGHEPYPLAMSLSTHASGPGSVGSGSGGGGGGSTSKPVYSKRGKITIVACKLCRKRKTKCDGQRPSCSQCRQRDSTCQYDMNEEERRPTYLRENYESQAEEKGILETILAQMRDSTDEDSYAIFRLIRGGTDFRALEQQIQASRNLTEFGQLASFQSQPTRESFAQIVERITAGPSAESDDVVRRLRQREPLEHILHSVMDTRGQSLIPMEFGSTRMEGIHPVHGARPMAGNSLAHAIAPTSDLAGKASSSMPRNSRWTQVTKDGEFIDHLLDVYFMWQHAFFQNFPEDLFRQNYESGDTQYCSGVLVNAICAAGCFLSDRPEARGDQTDPTSAGTAFFDEATRLLNENDSSSIPTTAGVFILSHVEGYRARLSAMWALVGRSARMALDLGLHLRNEDRQLKDMEDDDKRQEISRIHAFWGCFISDQVTSLTLGRLPGLSIYGVTVQLPPTNEKEDDTAWGPRDSPARNRPGARAATFRQCAVLSKIVNSTLLMFYSPSQVIKGPWLVDEYYSKYHAWYKQLPGILSATENAPAHVYSLHLYYHYAVLSLFRPFIFAQILESDLVPSELCRQAATAISDLFAKHMSLYGTTGIYTFQIQCLLAACTIHLFKLPAISATSALRDAINAFHSLATQNSWALGSLKLMRDMVHVREIILPGEIEELLYKAHTELPQSIRDRFGDPATPQAEASRGPKRAAFQNPSTQLMQKRQRLAPVQAQVSVRARTLGRESSSSVSGGKSGSEMHQRSPDTASMPVEQQTLRTSEIPFSPFPDQSKPLLGPVHTSYPVDDDWDEVAEVAQNFDGIKFEGDGWFDPFIGM